MKRVFLLIVLLSCAYSSVTSVSAQETGNRIYGNRGYYNQQRKPPTNTGSLVSSQYGWAIEASVLTNLKPDAFVVVFGINQEALGAAASNQKVNEKATQLAKALLPLGITANDIFVDFITQTPVYDYTVSGARATENRTGFETKKTIAIRYQNREQFERIVTAAADLQIFDLIKVDYVVKDFDAVRKRLFEEAVKVIKRKEQSYIKSFGVTLTPMGLANERYDAFYPADTYERYQAYETGDAYAYTSNGTTSKVIQRKSFTFFYQPFEVSGFDRVLEPLGIEPVVQFCLYLRMQYELQKPKQG
ncbi:MAG TPA: SIMPL domain-containing protein [Pyrinomonadaceae bacterium]|nr:SIMPL domain-containing protein [Pyrinomonadaceae bacterium]